MLKVSSENCNVRDYSLLAVGLIKTVILQNTIYMTRYNIANIHI